MKVASAAILALVLVGCGPTLPAPSELKQPSDATATPSVLLGGFLLALLPPDEVSPPAPRADIATPGGTLQGTPSDPHRAWLEVPGGRGRIELVWPRGYRAQFNPALIIVSTEGRVVAGAGDRVEVLCVTRGPGPAFIPLNSYPR